jgi:hypothetical protein
MPLSSSELNEKRLKFREKAGMFSRKLSDAFSKSHLEAIFLVLIIGSLFANIKPILAMFVLFYFLDRWGVKKLIIKDNEVNPQIEIAEEQLNKRTDE